MAYAQLRDKNTFWIAANIMFNLESGLTTQVLLLVNREEDATTFAADDVDGYFNFVTRRTGKIGQIKWSKEPSLEDPTKYVIKGLQHV